MMLPIKERRWRLGQLLLIISISVRLLNLLFVRSKFLSFGHETLKLLSILLILLLFNIKVVSLYSYGKDSNISISLHERSIHPN